jgi:hypothetical protein
MESSKIEWLLVLTMPNGGSTAFANLLLTGDHIISLNKHSEGQWLSPEMSSTERWNPSLELDYPSIREKWLAVVQQKTASWHDGLPPLVIEKSPPNMIRINKLQSMLAGMKTDILVLTREPYSTCASWLRRYRGVPPGWATNEQEQDPLRALARLWLRRARYLDEARGLAMDWIKYEDFSTDPAGIINRLSAKVERLRTVRPLDKIRVKDYPPQPVRNMNVEQIETLSPAQIDTIGQILTEDPDIVARLGYSLDLPA